MVAMGMKWHKDHFTCLKCNVPLTDTFVPKDGNPFCESCYQNSMKCTRNFSEISHIKVQNVICLLVEHISMLKESCITLNVQVAKLALEYDLCDYCENIYFL
jgi:hypothetical protein